MPRRTYGAGRRRVTEQGGEALARLEKELSRAVPEWQQRRIDERANRVRNQNWSQR